MELGIDLFRAIGPLELAGEVGLLLIGAHVFLLVCSIAQRMTIRKRETHTAGEQPVLAIWDEGPVGDALPEGELLSAISAMREAACDERVLEASRLLSQIKHTLSISPASQITREAQHQLDVAIRPGLSVSGLEKRAAEVRATLLDLNAVGPEWNWVANTGASRTHMRVCGSILKTLSADRTHMVAELGLC